jgi:hypothetical protein
MKKLKFEFPQALIPTLAVMISTLLVPIFLTTLNIANADSSPLSLVQLQPPHQQPDSNGMNITTNSNELRHNPLPFLPPVQQSQSQPLQPQHQQQPLNANGMSESHSNKFYNHSPSVVSILPF